MANGDFVYCTICQRSYVWLGRFNSCPFCGGDMKTEPFELPQFPEMITCLKHGYVAMVANQCSYCYYDLPYGPNTFTVGGTQWNVEKKENMQRKYLPTLSELIDRLTIVQQKELKIPQNRDEYTQELQDLMHDIQMCLGDNDIHTIDAEMIRDIVVLTLMNCEIWHNESNFRKGIKSGNNLELTHGLNGIRNTAKNKIQEKVGGRKDYKVDNVEAFKDWIPSGYKKEDEK